MPRVPMNHKTLAVSCRLSMRRLSRSTAKGYLPGLVRKVALTFALGVTSIASVPCQAQSASFTRLNFGEAIRIEVPRNWTYLDERLRKHINTAGEAAQRLAGIPPNSGENVVVVAANAYTSFRC